MQPVPLTNKVPSDPPPKEYCGLTGPQGNRQSVLNQYESLGMPPPPPSYAPPAYEPPSRSLYPTAPAGEEIYDEICNYGAPSEASYMHPMTNKGPGPVAYDNKAYDSQGAPLRGHRPSDRIGGGSHDENIYNSVHEDNYM